MLSCGVIRFAAYTKPKPNSINGYIYPYLYTLFAKRSYILYPEANPFISNNLNPENTKKKPAIKILMALEKLVPKDKTHVTSMMSPIIINRGV